MTYDTYATHNRTTKLKQPKSVKNDKYIWNDMRYTPLLLI